MRRCSCLPACLPLLLGVSPVSADWAGLSGYPVVAEIRVGSQTLHESIRIREDILPQFQPPDSPESNPDEWLARHLLEIKPEGASTLTARVESVSRETTARPPYRQINLEYSLPATPDRLQFTPSTDLPNPMGLVTLHEGVVVNDLAPLPARASLTRNDKNPWLSRFDQPTLVRNHSEPRSFLYVERHEVRHEILLRYTDLVSAMGYKPAQPDDLAPIGNFLLSKTALLIDGQTARPHLNRIEWVSYGAGGPTGLTTAQGAAEAGLVLGAVLVYGLDQPVNRLELTWNFSGNTERRNITVLSDREALDTYVTPNHPRLEWSVTDGGDLPVPSAPDQYDPDNRWSGGPLPDNQQFKTVLQAVLYNTYLAFQLADEEPAYDRLALGLSGDLLAKTYREQRMTWLQNRRGLGGGGTVDQVEILACDIVALRPETLAHDLDVHWRTHGAVTHYGHSHPQNRQYHARLTLQPTAAGRWKITTLTRQTELQHG